MTIRETLAKHLTDNGMFESQAEAVIEQFMGTDATQPMRGRWDDPTTEYPAALTDALLHGLCFVALEWIDANLPEAWYRPIFLPEDERKALIGC